MPTKTRKCYAKDPNKCRYHGKPENMRPGKNMAMFEKFRLAADVDAAQQAKAAKAKGSTQRALLEDLKADIIVDTIAQEGFFNDSEYADDDAEAAKKTFLDPNGSTEYTNRRNATRLHIDRNANGEIVRAKIASDKPLSEQQQSGLNMLNYELNARLRDPLTPKNKVPRLPITIWSQDTAVEKISSTIRDNLGGTQEQSDQVAKKIYKQTFQADEPSRRGAFWDAQQVLWHNYSGGGATAATAANIFENMMIQNHIPDDWQARV